MFFFFFQAEDGIRDLTVTGVQTCALPISVSEFIMLQGRSLRWRGRPLVQADGPVRYIAARRQGRELHVEVDAAAGCEVDLLGADRIVLSGESPTTVAVAGARRAASVGRGAPLSVTAARVEVS